MATGRSSICAATGLGDPLDWTLPPVDGDAGRYKVGGRFAAGADTWPATGRRAGGAGRRITDSPDPGRNGQPCGVLASGDCPFHRRKREIGAALAAAAGTVAGLGRGDRRAERGLSSWRMEAVVHTPAFARSRWSIRWGRATCSTGRSCLPWPRASQSSAAIRFASATAALKCTQLGGRSGTPSRGEVLAADGQRTPDADIGARAGAVSQRKRSEIFERFRRRRDHQTGQSGQARSIGRGGRITVIFNDRWYQSKNPAPARASNAPASARPRSAPASAGPSTMSASSARPAMGVSQDPSSRAR
jgi:hypothetical protein